MKKIITSILFIALILSKSILNAQTTHPFELGFNAGASWLKSDVKIKKLGGGGGFTFGQMYLQNEKSILDWGWRLRYLNALAYGQDTRRSAGIANNAVLNGTTDTTLNYNSNGGYVYQNYKTQINELSLELVVGANQLRNKTHFYPYIFGGIGITKAVTKTNQLNSNNQRYNYAKIDSNGTASNSDIASQLNNMSDGSYETTAEGSRNATWKFMPSLGIGFGFEIVKGFSIGLEHKMTWALSDGLDGQQWTNNNTRSLTNDMYHYTSIWIKFSFGRNSHTTTTTTNNTVTTTLDPSTYSSKGGKPSIVLLDPPSNPFTTSQQNYTMRATITNINSRSDISFIHNGISNNDFYYDPGTHTFTCPLILTNGSNSFIITAANSVGRANIGATVIFDQSVVVPVMLPAPVVNITSPVSNPHTTTHNDIVVSAMIYNIGSASQLMVSVNGTNTGAFSYNTITGQLSMNTNLIPGANLVTISASNPSGNDSKSETIIYSQPHMVQVPVITITSPASNPYTTSSNTAVVTATVLNIASASELSVSLNGRIYSAYSYTESTKQFSMEINLIPGANVVNIAASNRSGNDSKSETIIYSQSAAEPSPVVTITTPAANPYTTSINTAVVTASVLNVNSSSQIAVSVNGNPTTSFSYNASTKQLSLNTNLIVGANVITISASNASGNDSKSETIIYTQPAGTPAPVVTITSPAVNPYTTTNNTAAITATVSHVTSASQISVLVNGTITHVFSYNASTQQLTLSANLILGSNTITISASNTSGNDSKSETIIYSQPASVPAPVVTITTPITATVTTNLPVYNVIGTVLNVAGAGNITVKLNGTTLTGFTYVPISKKISFTANLIVGNNSIVISAVNSVGTDSKTVTITYIKLMGSVHRDSTSTNHTSSDPMSHKGGPTTGATSSIVKPTIVLSLPNPYTTSNPVLSVSAVINGVEDQSHIVLKLNGNVVPFTYNVTTKTLTASVTLILGMNTIDIDATNAAGTGTESLVVHRN